jgi:hypothetical protein
MDIHHHRHFAALTPRYVGLTVAVFRLRAKAFN